jgi:hypothetical protein
MKRKSTPFPFLHCWPELHETFAIDGEGALCARLFCRSASRTRTARRLAKLRKVARRGIYQARAFEESPFCAFTETFADHVISAISLENEAFGAIFIERQLERV